MLISLKSYYNKGYRTIRQIISRWAPSNENNTEKYILNVVRYSGMEDNTPITFNKQSVKNLVKAIIIQETGKLYMTDEDFENAWNLQ